jgi:hypothetical protein
MHVLSYTLIITCFIYNLIVVLTVLYFFNIKFFKNRELHVNS